MSRDSGRGRDARAMKARGRSEGSSFGHGMDGAKYPWVRFYPEAKRSDPALRACDSAARGVWEDLQHMMYGPEYGYAVLAPGRAPTHHEIARIYGIPLRQVDRCVAELERNGVFSRDERGIIYCRRMVRMRAAHEVNVAHGRKGGNPALVAEAAPHSAAEGLDQAETRRVTRGRKPVDGIQRTPNGSPAGIKRVPIDSNQSSNNSCLSGIGVNPPLKADSDSYRISKKESRNPSDSSPPGGGAIRGVQPAVVPDLDAGPPDSMPPPPQGQERPGRRPRKEPVGPVMRAGVERAPPAGPADLVAMEDAAVAAWNRMAAVGFPAKCTGLTGTRRQKLRARLREVGGLDAWHEAIGAIERSKLWQGQVTRRDRSQVWRPCFDDLLAPDKLRKLLEGGYDDTPPPSATPGPEGAHGRGGGPSQRTARKPHPLDDIVRKYGLEWMRDEPDPCGSPVVGASPVERVRVRDSRG